MDIPVKQILKQVNKIIRILTKVTEQHPKLSQEIDLALYASIKIQKIANKYMENISSQDQVFAPSVNEYKFTRNDDSQDAFFTSAVQSIENFKNNTFKLERKVNVLINQQETRNVRKIVTNQSVYPPTNVEKKMKKQAKSKRDIEKESDKESSQNLSQLDASILKIAKQLKKAISNEEEESIYGLSKQSENE